jgi:hypothetical protein
MKRTRLRRKSKNPKRRLFDRAWKAFRDYIIKRDKNVCFTCGRWGDQGGHFIHGKEKPTYFREDNVHVQCKRCNLFLDGNRDEYLRRIQKKYGIKRGDELLKMKYQIKKWSVKELEDIILKYKL